MPFSREREAGEPTSLVGPVTIRENGRMAAENSFLVPQGGLVSLLPLVLMLVWGLVAVLVGTDASRRGDSAVAWGLLALIMGPIGLLLYLAFRRPVANQ